MCCLLDERDSQCTQLIGAAPTLSPSLRPVGSLSFGHLEVYLEDVLLDMWLVC